MNLGEKQGTPEAETTDAGVERNYRGMHIGLNHQRDGRAYSAID